MKKKIKIVVHILVAAIVIVFSFANFIVFTNTSGNIKTLSCITETRSCVLVLGAGINSDGTPSRILKDRLDCALELYMKGFANTILVSGDSTDNNNEVAVMKEYFIKHNVSETAIAVDAKGFSTFESVRNAGRYLRFDDIYIVTQEYHLPRALYIANKFGFNAEGVIADKATYGLQFFYNIREFAARTKDFALCLFA